MEKLKYEEPRLNDMFDIINIENAVCNAGSNGTDGSCSSGSNPSTGSPSTCAATGSTPTGFVCITGGGGGMCQNGTTAGTNGNSCAAGGSA